MNERLQSEVYSLEPIYADKLFCPDDYHLAVKKANSIADGRSASKEIIQQSILVLGLKSKKYYRSRLAQIGSEFFGDPSFKQAEIEYLFDHAACQSLIKAITGVGVQSKYGIQQNLKRLTINNLKLLFTLFHDDEIVVLSSRISSVLYSLEKGYITQEKVMMLRKILSSQELLWLLESNPNFVRSMDEVEFSLDQLEQKLLELGADFELQSKHDHYAGDKVGLTNLYWLNQLPAVDRELILKKKKSMDWWIGSLNAQSIKLLDWFRSSLDPDLYQDFLVNNQDMKFLKSDLSQFQIRLDELKDLFKEQIPWRKLLLTKDNNPLQFTSVTNFSLEALRYCRSELGDDLAQYLLINHLTIFASPGARPNTATEIIRQVLELIEVESSQATDLCKKADFIEFCFDLFKSQIINGRFETTIENIKLARDILGQEQIVRLVSSYGGEHFLRNFHLIRELLSPSDLNLITSPAAIKNSSLWCFSFQADSRKDYLPRFTQLSADLKAKLVVLPWANKALQSQQFYQWMQNVSLDTLDALFDINGLGRLFHSQNTIDFYLKRFQLIIDVFNERTLIELMNSSETLAPISEIPDMTFSQLDVIDSLSAGDKEFYREFGLVLPLLTAPRRKDELKNQIGARLEPLFRANPDLVNVSGLIIKRLNLMRDRGMDINVIIKRLIGKLTDPGISYFEKNWFLFSRLYGSEQILKGTDPQLESLTFRDRYRRLKNRLEDLANLSQSDPLMQEAHRRNIDFYQKYVDQHGQVDEPLLLHGKSNHFPDDYYYGFRAAEFLGADLYRWGDKTSNALNFMLLPECPEPFIKSYHNQTDDISVQFGANLTDSTGITHLFRPVDVEAQHGQYAAKLYPGQHHGTYHKLISVGVPATTELAAVISTDDEEYFQQIKLYYAKLPYYVPLIDVETGKVVFSPSDFNRLRSELLDSGFVIDLERSESVEAFVNRLLIFYSEQDHVHGLEHIEHALHHLQPVCREIFSSQRKWFEQRDMSLVEYENLTKIAVVAHDIARGRDEDEDHALAGAKILSQIADYGMRYEHLNLVTGAIQQHNIAVENRWRDDPITQALYDIDKADTKFERGADRNYIEMVLPTIKSDYTKRILEDML